MRVYEVTITDTITYRVRAESEEHAVDLVTEGPDAYPIVDSSSDIEIEELAS